MRNDRDDPNAMYEKQTKPRWCSRAANKTEHVNNIIPA